MKISIELEVNNPPPEEHLRTTVTKYKQFLKEIEEDCMLLGVQCSLTVKIKEP